MGIFQMLDIMEPWSAEQRHRSNSEGVTWSKVILFPILLALAILMFVGYIFITVMSEV